MPSVDQKGREHAKYDLRQKKKEKKRTEREKRNSFVCLLLVSDPKQWSLTAQWFIQAAIILYRKFEILVESFEKLIAYAAFEDYTTFKDTTPPSKSNLWIHFFWYHNGSSALDYKTWLFKWIYNVMVYNLPRFWVSFEQITDASSSW